MPKGVKIGIQYPGTLKRRIISRFNIFNSFTLIYKNILGCQSLFFANGPEQLRQRVINRHLPLFLALGLVQIDQSVPDLAPLET